MKEFRAWVDVTVRFRDLDAMGHVNNAVYLTYLEHARVAYDRLVKIFFNSEEKSGFILARAEIDFKAPISLGEKVRVYIRAANWRQKSFDFIYRLESLSDGRLLALAKTVQVAFDYAAGRSAEIPAADLAKMKSFESHDQPRA